MGPRVKASRPQTTVLVRVPLPGLPPADLALLEDAPRLREDDVEAALLEIRQARRLTHQTDDRTSWYVNLQRAEKFVSDCLECGPASTHQTKGSHLSLALSAWSQLYPRHASHISQILDAFSTVLEWRGGYRITRQGSTVYFGVALNEGIIARINARRHGQDVVETTQDLSRSILASFD